MKILSCTFGYINFLIVVMFAFFYIILIDRPVLLVLFSILLALLSYTLGHELDKIYYRSIYCVKTKLYNTNFFYERLPIEFELMKKDNIPVSFCFLDIYSYKKFNYFYTNKLIENFSLALNNSKVKTKFIINFGSGKFLLVLPNNDKLGTRVVVERILKNFILKSSYNLVFHYGISRYPDNGKDLEKLLADADILSYSYDNISTS